MAKASAMLLAVTAMIMVTGCANSSGARMGLFSARAPVYAMLVDDLFTGEAIGYMDRTGTIDIVSVVDNTVRCVGEFRYTGSKTGEALVQCNDGAVAELKFNALSMISGYGYGQSTRGPASFTYGLTPEEATEYLRLPEGASLIRTPENRVVLEST